MQTLHISFNTLVHRNGREWSWPKAGRRTGSGFRAAAAAGAQMGAACAQVRALRLPQLSECS